MAEVVNELTVVTKLRALSLDPNNQPYIVRRNILPTLLKFLTCGDKQVTLLAAETLNTLSSHPDNPDYMCREKGLVPAVVKLYQATPDPELKASLGGLMKNLHNAVPNAGAPKDKAAPAAPAAASAPESRCLLFRLPTLTDASAPATEKAVLQLKGVVSCTCAVDDQVAKVYVQGLTDADFAAAMQEAGLQGEVVAQAPAVPSEYQRSLVASGENSLAARLERQKEERLKERQRQQAQEEGMGRFFRKITSAFW
eukprot:NODE_1066_length_1078_cov_180.125364_g743_i0.p1 GENE.NODE_1066_length_1078_cov_180.125364_g743_i0~~NODE_1066_length_1078_cov_180.125364_g743_i0.p1  ORF type:complete len:254 (-),score=77.95 NODE_1066_length_1078_cov_180.125364_g743_i0:245-1006(-)